MIEGQLDQLSEQSVQFRIVSYRIDFSSVSNSPSVLFILTDFLPLIKTPLFWFPIYIDMAASLTLREKTNYAYIAASVSMTQ